MKLLGLLYLFEALFKYDESLKSLSTSTHESVLRGGNGTASFCPSLFLSTFFRSFLIFCQVPQPVFHLLTPFFYHILSFLPWHPIPSFTSKYIFPQVRFLFDHIFAGPGVPTFIFAHTLYLLTPWSRVLLEKQIVSQVIKKFPAVYGTIRCITTFTADSHLFLSWAR